MANIKKFYRSEDVLKAIDDICVSEIEESDDDEGMSADLVVDGDMLVDFGGQIQDCFSWGGGGFVWGSLGTLHGVTPQNQMDRWK